MVGTGGSSPSFGDSGPGKSEAPPRSGPTASDSISLAGSHLPVAPKRQSELGAQELPLVESASGSANGTSALPSLRVPQTFQPDQGEVLSETLTQAETDKRLVVFEWICQRIREASSISETLECKAFLEKGQLVALIEGDHDAQRRFAVHRIAALQRLGEPAMLNLSFVVKPSPTPTVGGATNRCPRK